MEQPRQKGQRFRYECEGRYAGHIPGESSTEEEKTYPTVELCNMGSTKEAIIVASCVTKDEPYKAHPHSLVGRECNKGVCTVKLKHGDSQFVFQNLGIRCAKKKAIKDKLLERKQIRVDPYGAGFNHVEDISNIDLHCVRICFQAFLPDPEANGQFRKIVKPVVTQPIFDHKSGGEMKICRVSACAGSVQGGTEIFMLTDRIAKDDIEIIFQDEGRNWTDRGRFGSTDVHHQFAIVFKSPSYPFQISEPCKVNVFLKKKSDDSRSQAIEYTYFPHFEDYEIGNKRRRKEAFAPHDFQNSTGAVSNTILDKVKMKVTRNIGATPVVEPQPQMPFVYEDQEFLSTDQPNPPAVLEENFLLNQDFQLDANDPMIYFNVDSN